MTKAYEKYDEINEQGCNINHYIKICTFCPDTKAMSFEYEFYENEISRDKALEVK